MTRDEMEAIGRMAGLFNQRIAQFMFNAVYCVRKVSNEDVHQVLFYMTDKDLYTACSNYYKQGIKCATNSDE
jgi:hypothetical protein